MTLGELPEDMAREANTPAANHSFQVNKTPVPLDETTTIMFHHNVAKLLFLCLPRPPNGSGLSYNMCASPRPRQLQETWVM